MKNTFSISSIVFLLLFLYPVISFSQSRFTLFHAAPLLFNPSQTGRFNKDYRLSISHRREINPQKQIYNQSYFSGDFKLFRNKIAENDFIGVGIGGLNEKSDNEGITNNYLSISSAYHKALNEDGSRLLSLGFQLSLVRNNLNKPTYVFEDQLVSWAKAGYNNINPFILPNNLNVNYTDLNAGINFQSKINERNYLGVGIAIQHVTSPNKTFQGGELNVPRETISHLSWETIFSGNKKLYSNLIGAFSEKDLSKLIAGIDLEFPFKMEKSFSTGCWFRKNPYVGYSVSPAFALKLYDLRIQFAYDINISQTTTTQRAINFNIMYIAAKSREGYLEKKFIRF